jgi:exonuclease SbcC
MILSRLRLSNFRQYRQLDLQFKEGITGIVGSNGSGKSTILEAVLWCLFGNRAARTGKEGIKRQTAPASDPCSVQLEFVLGNTSYCLTRSLIGKNHKSEARLSRFGQLDAVSTREVDDYIVRLIGLNLKGFLSSFFARQKELNALSEARPADRKDHLAKMLGVGRLDNTIQLLKDEIKSTRQNIDILSSLRIDPETVSQELKQKKIDISELEKAKASHLQDLNRNKETISGQSQQLESFKQKELEDNRIEKEHSALMARKDAADKEISRLSAEFTDLQKTSERLEPLKKKTEGIDELDKIVTQLRKAGIREEEKKRLEKELGGLQKAEVDHEKSRSETDKAIANLREKLASLDTVTAEIEKMESERELLLKEHQNLTGELRVVEDRLKTMEKQKGEIGELGPEAVCELCLRPFAGELDEIERHFDQEILSLRQKAEPMNHHLSKITAKGKDLGQHLKSTRENQIRLNKFQQDLASSQASLNALLETINENHKRTLEIDKRLKEIGKIEFDSEKLSQQEAALKEKQTQRDDYIRLAERAGRIPAVKDGLEKAQAAMKTVTDDLEKNIAQKAKIGFDRAKFQKVISELEKARDEAATIRLEIERAEGKIRLLTSEAEAHTQKLAEYEKSKKEISRLRENLTYLEKLSLLFSEFRVHLIGRIRPSLSKRTSHLFQEMTAGRYQEIVLDENYNLRVYDRNEHFPINRFSGGEVDLANLCFRLAISVEMAATAGIEQSFIILDEIFGSQDAERQRMIFDGLGRLKSRFRQIIIISHIDDVKEMAENIVAVEVDPSGISRVTATVN